MRAKRCFDVRYKDGQKSCIRWILAAPAHPELMQPMIHWYELSEEQLTMTMCGALRGEARHGQVDASWDPYKSCFQVATCTQSGGYHSVVNFDVFSFFLPCVNSGCLRRMWAVDSVGTPPLCLIGWSMLQDNSCTVLLPSLMYPLIHPSRCENSPL